MSSYKHAIYESYRSSFKGGYDRAQVEFVGLKVLPILSKWCTDCPKDADVLDLGCGAGEVLWAFRKLGFEKLSGCDISAEQVAIARKVVPEVQEQDIFECLKQRPDDSIDIVTLFDVIEHLTKQESFDLLIEIHRVLRGGGRLIAHCPNGLSPFVGTVFWGDLTHEWCPTPASAENMCKAIGYVDFVATERLAASSSIAGLCRKLGWSLVRAVFRLINYIEMKDALSVWTRSFVFTCRTTNVPSHQTKPARY
jgi:SAM-dependent methyltransferase